MNIHVNHRKRMRKLYLSEGASALTDRQLLEMLLFYAFSQGDVSPKAHALLERFGSLENVINAQESELTEVYGIGKRSAELIKLVPVVGARYLREKWEPGEQLGSTTALKNYFIDRLRGKQEMMCMAVCLDTVNTALSCRVLARGSQAPYGITPRALAAFILGQGGRKVVLARNCSGISLVPAGRELDAVQSLRANLGKLNLSLEDYITVSEDSCLSLRENGLF